jgi:transcriptional regulator with XRE-family HTH domain
VTKAVPSPSSLAHAIAAQVKALRTQRGWTQAQLAEAAEMTSDEVSRIERGTREPRFVTIERLAEALAVPPARLLAASEDREPRAVSKSRQSSRDCLALRRAVEKCLRLLQAALDEE